LGFLLARDGAALFVAADEQRDRRRSLIRRERGGKVVLGEPFAACVLIIPPEEQKAAEVIGSDVLRSARFGAADKEELADLFLKAHVCDDVVDALVGRFSTGCGVTGAGSGAGSGSGVSCRFVPQAESSRRSESKSALSLVVFIRRSPFIRTRR